MKPATIEKVNGLGKAGYILATITKVVLIIGLVVLVPAAVICFAIPTELYTVRFDAQAAIDVNCGTLGITAEELSDRQLSYALDNINSAGYMSVDDMELLLDGVSVSGDTITFSGSGNAKGYGIGQIRTVLVLGVLSLALYLVCTFFVAGFCKALSRCASPFEPELVKKMQTLAWATLALPIVSSLTESVPNNMLTGTVDIQISIDLMEVILVLAMFALAYIFKYGAQLQQESDETL